MKTSLLGMFSVVGGLLALGCASPTTPTEAPRVENGQARPVVLDGEVDDWPGDLALTADEDYIYFRFSLGSDAEAPQAMEETLTLWLDVDGRADTGQHFAEPADAKRLGVDVEIKLSPRDPDGSGRGVAIFAYANGERTRVNHADVDFMFSPTYASTWHEGRIARRSDGDAWLPWSVASAAGTMRAMLVIEDEDGPTNRWSDPFTGMAPAAAQASGEAMATIPAAEPGTVRVMTYNVLWNSPVEGSGSFERLIQAIDPDIILVQEWNYDAPQLNGWFNALIPSPEPWRSASVSDLGVAVIARHPLRPIGDGLVTAEDVRNDEERSVRFVGAIVRTPVGEVAVGSAHLKCCGAAGSWEDRQRLAEARAINEHLNAWLGTAGPGVRVIGGDINLVGSRPPLDALADGLDADGSDLAVAKPKVLGDAAVYTWKDATSDFSAGRLDYLLVGDAGAEIVRSFIVDTYRIDPQALAAMGLERTDSGGSDHLPQVVDVRPRSR